MSDKPRKYACIMINMPPMASKAMAEAQQKIDPKDLYTEEANGGLEDQHHVTIFYGLDDHYKNLILRALQTVKPFSLQFGDISAFDTNPKNDVLKFDIDNCPELHKLHEAIKAIYPNEYKFDEYRPHATLSYNKPGTAKKYVGMPNNVTGRVITVKHIIYSDCQSNKTLIKIK